MTYLVTFEDYDYAGSAYESFEVNADYVDYAIELAKDLANEKHNTSNKYSESDIVSIIRV